MTSGQEAKPTFKNVTVDLGKCEGFVAEVKPSPDLKLGARKSE